VSSLVKPQKVLVAVWARRRWLFSRALLQSALT